MQATMSLSKKANRASGISTDAALPALQSCSVTGLKHIAVREGLQEEVEALAGLAAAYGRFALHPSKMTGAQLAAEENELQGFIGKLGDALATLDSRRRALVSERGYRANMQSSARIERAAAVLI